MTPTIHLFSVPHIQSLHIFLHSDSTSQTLFKDDFKATKHYCSVDQQVITNSTLPVIRGDSPHGLHDAGQAVCCSAQDVHTWLGAVACGLDVYKEGSPGNYVTTFEPPEPIWECDHGMRSRWTGMVSAGYIWTLISALRCVCVCACMHG